MALDRHPATLSQPPMSITECDGGAVLRFTGRLSAHHVFTLEQQLLDPRLTRAGACVLDLSALTHIDLICAYALRRAATRLSATAPVRVRGARRTVQRKLRYAGVAAVASIEE
ncbi:STAS domain-containing protein [Streptomyces sp. NPDC088762]|uniref:STAS domain-containing protein n=1 Tax=Streptomyces sp. NPDC088762 TaxID=3365891 RepID=UPI0038125FCC